MKELLKRFSEFQEEREPITSITPVRWLETGVTEARVHLLPGTLKILSVQ